MTTRRFVHEGFRSLDSRDLSVDFDSGLYKGKKASDVFTVCRTLQWPLRLI